MSSSILVKLEEKSKRRKMVLIRRKRVLKDLKSKDLSLMLELEEKRFKRLTVKEERREHMI